MALKKIKWDKKNSKMYFYYKGSRHLPEVTEYIVDEWALEGMFDYLVNYSFFIEKKVDGRQIYPEKVTSIVKRHREQQRYKRIFALAIKVFENEESAWKWFHRSQMALGNRRPIDMMSTAAEAQVVEDVLGRIEHGVYS